MCSTVLLRSVCIIFSALFFFSLEVALAESVVQITNPQALRDSLADAKPGTNLILAAGDYGPLVLTGGGEEGHPITLRSADPTDPAQFSQLYLKDAKYLILDGLTFDYSFLPGDPTHVRPFSVEDSDNILIRRSLFDGDVAQGVSLSDDGYGNGYGLGVSRSTHVTVEQNEIRRFHRGLVISESSNITVRNNDLYGMRSDGMDFAQVENLLIAENIIRDFDGSALSDDHPDMIQFWTSGTTSPSRNIEIRDNVLNSGLGWYTQSIFMRNERVDQGEAGSDMFYQDVVITGNVIINAHLHGITVGETTGLQISHNTLIRNAATKGIADESGLWTPVINVAATSTDVKIVQNVTPMIAGYDGQADWTVLDNLLIQDQNVHSPGFYDTVFVAARTGDPRQLASFGYLPGGPLDGTGLGASRLADILQHAVLTPVIQVVADPAALNRFTFDAGLSAGSDGTLGPATSFHWMFADGTRMEGQKITRVFGTAGVQKVTLHIRPPHGDLMETTAQLTVPSPEVLTFTAETTQILSWSAGTPRPVPETPSGVTRLRTGQVPISIPPEYMRAFFDAGDFELLLTLRPIGSDPAGELLRIHTNLLVTITPRGAIEVDFDTGAGGQIHLATGPLHLFTDGWHDMRLRYSATTGRFDIALDGQVVAEAHTAGLTKPLEYWGFSLGNPFGDRKSFEGEIKDLILRSNVERFVPAP